MADFRAHAVRFAGLCNSQHSTACRRSFHLYFCRVEARSAGSQGSDHQQRGLEIPHLQGIYHSSALFLSGGDVTGFSGQFRRLLTAKAGGVAARGWFIKESGLFPEGRPVRFRLLVIIKKPGRNGPVFHIYLSAVRLFRSLGVPRRFVVFPPVLPSSLFFLSSLLSPSPSESLPLFHTVPPCSSASSASRSDLLPSLAGPRVS